MVKITNLLKCKNILPSSGIVPLSQDTRRPDFCQFLINGTSHKDIFLPVPKKTAFFKFLVSYMQGINVIAAICALKCCNAGFQSHTFVFIYTKLKVQYQMQLFF